ncbi:glycosyltransferase family 2 protein [Treponema peruense]|uniref:Glycosyltransferase family 2 protein n=1 Tax=Treponema peruense TaxID=2787628 RepID=A0A7T3RBJ2_9SPIR|nr:glycosyltransferase family 2 protein [Treponema peruense]QQA00068.1 glycosyltransferase family 2 protein [Treponema peruense]
MNSCKLSVVVPCFNEQEAVPIFYNEVKKILVTLKAEYEIIFIDDGSSDKTLEEVKELSEKDKGVHYVSFSRNFGKEAAMYAGLKKAAGDYVVIMDVDLQDPPSLIPEMLSAVCSGEFDSAATRRTNRKGEPPVRSMFARLFYKLMRYFSDIDIVDGARDFRMMSRTMVDAVLSVSERGRFSKGIFAWVGFRTKYFEYKNVERSAGKTKWNFRKLFLYSLDGIVAFSTKPLVLASITGILFLFLSFLFIIFIIVRKVLFGDPTAGWPSLVCIILFVSGIQLFCTGILGQYLAKVYLETKQRPLYIAKDEK